MVTTPEQFFFGTCRLNDNYWKTVLIFIIILQISMFISVFSVFVHENVR